MSESSLQSSPPPRVVLVDDHDLFRTGLRNLLSEQNGIQINVDLEVIGQPIPACFGLRGFGDNPSIAAM